MLICVLNIKFIVLIVVFYPAFDLIFPWSLLFQNEMYHNHIFEPQ